MRIFSSAENCRRVARRICFTTCSAGSFTGLDFCPICAPSMATMGPKSSLPQPAPFCLIGADAGHCGIYSPAVVIPSLSPKSGKAALARIPLLADLIQAGRRGGAVLSVRLVRCLELVDVPDEVIDGGFLAHVSSLPA